jgi:hypothetical protein
MGSLSFTTARIIWFLRTRGGDARQIELLHAPRVTRHRVESRKREYRKLGFAWRSSDKGKVDLIGEDTSD